MTTVIIEGKDGKRPVTVEAKEGSALQDLCDDHDSLVPFSCRSASCATCHIEVLEGADLLAAPDDEELDVLDAIDSTPPRFRLACCAKVGATSGRIRVRAQNDY